MEPISSGQTFFVKRVFPAIWVGGIALALFAGASAGHAQRHAPFLIVPALMLVFGFFLFRKLVWDLADRVEDHGSYLLVQRGREEARVSLSNVMNISMSQFTRPPRLTLRLRQPGPWGDEVVFIPKLGLRMNPFARNEVAENLMRRIDAARTTGNHPT